MSTGIISTFAGTGSASYNGDNVDATAAALNTPQTVAVDPSGLNFLYFYCFFLLFACISYRERVRR